jgi:hypothetical protein
MCFVMVLMLMLAGTVDALGNHTHPNDTVQDADIARIVALKFELDIWNRRPSDDERW